MTIFYISIFFISIFLGGRVKEVHGTHRVYLALDEVPGLAMSRSLGDYVAHSAGQSDIFTTSRAPSLIHSLTLFTSLYFFVTVTIYDSLILSDSFSLFYFISCFHFSSSQASSLHLPC